VTERSRQSSRACDHCWKLLHITLIGRDKNRLANEGMRVDSVKEGAGIVLVD